MSIFFKRVLKTVVCLLILLINKTQAGSFSDSTSGSWGISPTIHWGFLIAHRPSMLHLQTAHTLGIEIDYVKTSNGIKPWQHRYLFPDYGVAYVFMNVGNKDVIGNVHGIYPFLDLPFTKGKYISFNARIGCGLGYCEKKFTQYDNYKNNAIGSHFNTIINLRLMLEAKITATSKAGITVGVSHWSNGSVATPNLGINVATASLYFKKYFGETKQLNRTTDAPIKKHWEYTLLAGGFVKQIYPALSRNYFAGSLCGDAQRIVSYKSAFTLGGDVFFDGSLITKLKADSSYTNDWGAVRCGVHLGYHLLISKLTLGVESGFYVYQQWTGDGWMYQRIVVRDQITKKLFACLNLKTHFAKADYVELGLGWKF